MRILRHLAQFCPTGAIDLQDYSKFRRINASLAAAA
jgi:hypothetical protein